MKQIAISEAGAVVTDNTMMTNKLHIADICIATAGMHTNYHSSASACSTLLRLTTVALNGVCKPKALPS